MTDREWQCLWKYTRVGSNASRAATIVYGGTPISMRVKGYKKRVKLKRILDVIDGKTGQSLVRTPDESRTHREGTEQIEREVDAYLNAQEFSTALVG